MIDHLSLDGSLINVHAAESSLKMTKNFTHGSLIFDIRAGTVTFGTLPPVEIPPRLTFADGSELTFHLVTPDGTLAKQTRSGVLKANETQRHILRIAGKSKTPRKFSAQDGWGNAIYKYRAYFSHPGLKTDGKLPEWLVGSIARQKALWNRMAWLCREARLKCSPVPTDRIVGFVQNTILPEIDAFNHALGDSREKMRHPARLKIETPGLDGLWTFAGALRTRAKKGRAIPVGLLDKVVEFAEQFKPDYKPLNDFLAGFRKIAEREAASLCLRYFEAEPTIMTFKTVIDRRRTAKLPWSAGWPLIKYADRPNSADWGLHYRLNKAGVNSASLENGNGVQGLSFGPPLAPFDTGHKELKGVAAKRIMREAQISIAGDTEERWIFRFGILQHRPLPPNSHLKEWKLIFQDGALWLCLVVELQHPVPIPGPVAAGLDIGWRRTEEGIRFGTLYEAATESFRELTVDLQRTPRDQNDRVPFRIDLGPSRWEKRNVKRLFPGWKPGDPLPGVFEARTALQTRRDALLNTTKRWLRECAGDRMPAWFDKTGRRGLLRLEEKYKDDGPINEVLSAWRQEDEQLGKLISMYFDRTTKRIAYEHAQVAHDVCRHLQQKSVTRLIVETSFLARTSQLQNIDAPISLRRSQKYRQFVAIGKFVAVLKNTAIKHGIVVDTVNAMNITRVCQYCGVLNPGTEKERYICKGCERQVKQDQNAAVNLSRFGSTPEDTGGSLHADAF